MDGSYFDSFSKKAEDGLALVALKTTDLELRDRVCEEVHMVAASMGAAASEFGSHATRLASKTSDIDIAIKFPSDVFQNRVEKCKKEKNKYNRTPEMQAIVSFLKEMTSKLCEQEPSDTRRIWFKLVCPVQFYPQNAFGLRARTRNCITVACLSLKYLLVQTIPCMWISALPAFTIAQLKTPFS